MPPSPTQRILPYAAAIATLIVVTVGRLALSPVIGPSVSFLPFTLPVVVAALLGGFIPATTMIAISLAAADWFVIHPIRSLSVSNTDEVVRMMMFIVVGLVIAILGERQYRALWKLEDAAQRIARSESRFRRLAESNLFGTFISHVEGTISDANDGFLDMIGYTRRELDAGRIRWPEMTPPEHLAADQKGIEEAIARGSCTPYEKEYFHKDGHRVPVLIGYARVLTSDDEYIVFVADLTKQKQVQRELLAAKEEAEAANASKDEFLMVVSHELRTPMTALLGWVQMLMMGHIDPKDFDIAIRRIHESALAEIEIIENILDVARLAVGKFATRRDLVDVSAVAASALAQFEARAAERSIRLTREIEPNLMVIGDGDRIRQVVNNLLSNALKFTEVEGDIVLRAGRRGEYVEVEVRDDGIGIAPDFLPHVFERFRQADSAHSRRYGGLGLGLAIARHLIESQGGQIRAESDGLGLGARFVVALPAA